MSKTLLDGVNEVLKRVNVIATGALFTTLTDTAQQHEIDTAIQIINEGIDELFSSTTSLVSRQAEGTFTLALNTREYSLASDFASMVSDHLTPIIDRTNYEYMYPFDGGYNWILLYDPQQIFTGLPLYWAISPVTGKLRVERAPDSTVAGRIYTYQYEKVTSLVASTDTMPFNDEAFRAMVPAWAELYNKARKNAMDAAAYQVSMARAARMARESGPKTSYGSR